MTKVEYKREIRKGLIIKNFNKVRKIIKDLPSYLMQDRYLSSFFMNKSVLFFEYLHPESNFSLLVCLNQPKAHQKQFPATNQDANSAIF